MNNLLISQLCSRKLANPPSAISLSFYYSYADMVVLTYTKPTYFPTGFSNFKVYRDGLLVDTFSSFGANWYDYYVSPNTTYAYKIRAYDLNGQYSESSIVYATTADGTPPVVWNFGVGTTLFYIYPGCMCSAVNLLYLGYVHCWRASTNTHYYEYDYSQAGLTSGMFNFTISKATLGSGSWEISMVVRDYNMNDTLTGTIVLYI